MIKNDGAWAKTTNKLDDTNKLPVQQAASLGNLRDWINIAPYGMHYSAPIDTLCTVINGQKRISMATSAIDRIEVESGEVVYFHPVTKTKIHMKNSGAVTISDAGGTTLTLSNGQVTIVAASIELDGDVAITGDLDVSGKSKLGSSATPADGIARIGDTVSGGVITGGSTNNIAD